MPVPAATSLSHYPKLTRSTPYWMLPSPTCTRPYVISLLQFSTPIGRHTTMQIFPTTLALATALALTSAASSQTQQQPPPAQPESVTAAAKLAERPPVTYDNKYELYGGIGLQNFQAGQQLPKKMVFGNIEINGTRWLNRRIGVAVDFRGGAGTTQVFPNSDLSRPLVVQYTGMGGVQYRGPKNQFAAINYHAYAGAMHGIFDETARQDLNVGLYTNRTGAIGVVGGSVDFNYTRQIAFRFSPDLVFEHLGDETREFFALSGGVIYRFGKK